MHRIFAQHGQVALLCIRHPERRVHSLSVILSGARSAESKDLLSFRSSTALPSGAVPPHPAKYERARSTPPRARPHTPKHPRSPKGKQVLRLRYAPLRMTNEIVCIFRGLTGRTCLSNIDLGGVTMAFQHRQQLASGNQRQRFVFRELVRIRTVVSCGYKDALHRTLMLYGSK